MKIRSGFVSNSSSSSFIVVGSQPPAIVPSILLNDATARRVIARALQEIRYDQALFSDDNPSAYNSLKKIDPTKEDVWLTAFLSDAGAYTDPLDDANCPYWAYQSGAHDGPYDEDAYIKLTNLGRWGNVWVRKEDIRQEKEIAKTPQLEFSFIKMKNKKLSL